MNYNIRQRNVGGCYDHLIDYLKCMHLQNPSFYYSLNNNNNHNIFWADTGSRVNYSYFGDTVVFDTSFRGSGYKLPLCTFTGLNHHGQPVLFGCALIADESEDVYVWLLRTWLDAMSGYGNTPVSITSEPRGFVQMAVADVLPNVRHRYCKGSVFKETRARLGCLYRSGDSFGVEFRECVEGCDTVEEFECRWRSLLERYYLIDDKWLKSLYEGRHNWIPVYMRGSFFGELNGNEVGRTYFDGFINAATTMQMLVKQYEKAVSSWHEKELLANDNTINTIPILKTPSPMEKQAANLYTREVFIKFQEELVETLANPATKLEEVGTITTFRVAKFGENHRAHVVSFNSLETKASCSCQMFEFCGIICRHILSVFRAKNVLTLPSEYVLRRWTRNAKSSASLDECVVGSLTNLRQEAIKFVEEGAKSIHVYNVAMDALQEAAKKVNAVKNRAALANGDSQVHTGGFNQVASDQSADEKAKKIRELTAELENTNKRCEFYRTNLLAVLKDMEEQKLKLSVKVQNARLSLKE